MTYSAASTLGELLDNPDTKAILEKHVPDLVANEQLSMARGMALDAVAQIPQANVKEDTLKSIVNELGQVTSVGVSSAEEAPSIPDHVPQELVFDAGMGDIQSFMSNAFSIWRRLQEEAPPLFYSPSSGMMPGGWFVQTGELLREVLQQGEVFSNSRAGGGAGGQSMWPRKLVPLEIDPPEHGKYRALLAKAFSPKMIDGLEGSIEGCSTDIIDGFKDQGHCDFMADYARKFPIIVLMQLVGLPLERREEFSSWEHKMFQGATMEERQEAGKAVAAMLAQLIEEKRANPSSDLFSQLAKSEVDGKPIATDKLEDMAFLLFIAGLDTVTGGLGHIFRYLAENPEQQQKLRDNPDLIPDAVEEMLRYHTWIPTGRTLSTDTEFHGVQMKEGERVMCLTYNASHDPAETPNPETVDFTRVPNPHFAFGAGVHRCAGSHLARRELRVAVRQMLESIPTFRVKAGVELKYDGGLVCLGALPLEWDV